MRILNKYTPIAIMFIATISCKTVIKSTTADVDYINISKEGIMQNPLVADLVVAPNKRIISRSYSNITLAKAKELIMGDFIIEANCDIVIQPHFVATTSTMSTQETTIDIKLTAYPGNYTNIKNADKYDLSIINNKYLLLEGGPSKQLAKDISVTRDKNVVSTNNMVTRETVTPPVSKPATVKPTTVKPATVKPTSVKPTSSIKGL